MDNNQRISGEFNNFFNLLGGATKLGGERKAMKDLMKQGYLFYRNKEAIKVFSSNPKYANWTSQSYEDGFKFYPPANFMKDLASLNDENVATMCAIVRLNRINKPLYLSIKKKNVDEWVYVLSCFNNAKGEFEILNTDAINCSIDLIIKALPILNEDIKIDENIEIITEKKDDFFDIANDVSSKGTIVLRDLSDEDIKRIEYFKNSLSMFNNFENIEKDLKELPNYLSKDMEDKSNYNPANDNCLYQQDLMKELLQKGYMSFDSLNLAKKVAEDPRYKNMTLEEIDGEFRVIPKTNEITELRDFINDSETALLCAMVKTNCERPLSFLIEKLNDEECLVKLSYFNSSTNEFDNLGTYNIPYCNELFIKALPTIYLDLIHSFKVPLVIEQENKFKLDKENAYNGAMIFRGFGAQDQNVIVGMKKFAEEFKSGQRNKVKFENVIFTGYSKSLSQQIDEKREKKEAEEIINNFDMLADKNKGPLYITLTERGDGYLTYKLDCYDLATKKIKNLFFKAIHSLGLFTEEALPYIVNKLEERGKVDKNFYLGAFDMNTIISNPETCKNNQVLLIGFTKDRIDELYNKIFPNSIKTAKEKEDAIWKPFNEYADYRRSIESIIKEQGYLDLNTQEMEEFSQKSEYNYFDRTYKNGRWIVYPSTRELNFFDKEINDSMALSIINTMKEDSNQLSLIVDCFLDGTCTVKLKKFNKEQLCLDLVKEVRVLFNGNFLHNVLKLANDVFSITGQMEVIDLDLKDRNKPLNGNIFVDKNVLIFYGLTPDMKESVMQVIDHEYQDGFKL